MSEAERFLRREQRASRSTRIALPSFRRSICVEGQPGAPAIVDAPPSTDGSALADVLARGGDLPVIRAIPRFHVGSLLLGNANGSGTGRPELNPSLKLSWFHCSGGAAEARKKADVLAEPRLEDLG